MDEHFVLCVMQHFFFFLLSDLFTYIVHKMCICKLGFPCLQYVVGLPFDFEKSEFIVLITQGHVRAFFFVSKMSVFFV